MLSLYAHIDGKVYTCLLAGMYIYICIYVSIVEYMYTYMHMHRHAQGEWERIVIVNL